MNFKIAFVSEKLGIFKNRKKKAAHGIPTYAHNMNDFSRNWAEMNEFEK